jgi:hypothetical protein
VIYYLLRQQQQVLLSPCKSVIDPLLRQQQQVLSNPCKSVIDPLLRQQQQVLLGPFKSVIDSCCEAATSPCKSVIVIDSPAAPAALHDSQQCCNSLPDLENFLN